ncbi:MAG: hypothetical protein VZQ46_04530 [Megasphaera elsdenii]|nr:hypothetical protein [Megasphaera elsdenii]
MRKLGNRRVPNGTHGGVRGRDFYSEIPPTRSTAYPSDTEGSVSDKVVMEKIADLVAGEDKSHPYSDQDLSECLALSDRISVARRTVTKLRQKLNIPNSRIRRL